MTAASSDVAFTTSVQTAHGSREDYARMKSRGGFRAGIIPELESALASTDTAYLEPASALVGGQLSARRVRDRRIALCGC